MLTLTEPKSSDAEMTIGYVVKKAREPTSGEKSQRRLEQLFRGFRPDRSSARRVYHNLSIFYLDVYIAIFCINNPTSIAKPATRTFCHFMEVSCKGSALVILSHRFGTLSTQRCKRSLTDISNVMPFIPPNPPHLPLPPQMACRVP